ncbi:hypothetical protein F2P81_003297 [Scophthalmus maximus]|uniref:Uncharacterized protein n=1 Tax=Scophthalmus maximus TaxID=52904 RepID=A0A6A4TH35_SCOMX|nr:hypothetical protein F2P81_003297 [Scophthalmus maximus]
MLLAINNHLHNTSVSLPLGHQFSHDRGSPHQKKETPHSCTPHSSTCQPGEDVSKHFGRSNFSRVQEAGQCVNYDLLVTLNILHSEDRKSPQRLGSPSVSLMDVRCLCEETVAHLSSLVQPPPEKFRKMSDLRRMSEGSFSRDLSTSLWMTAVCVVSKDVIDDSSIET